RQQLRDRQSVRSDAERGVRNGVSSLAARALPQRRSARSGRIQRRTRRRRPLPWGSALSGNARLRDARPDGVPKLLVAFAMATLTRPQPLPRISAAAFRLPILDGYMLREMLGPFMFAFGAFLLFWALNIFFLAADYIINQHAPFFLVLRFVIFRIPQAIP